MSKVIGNIIERREDVLDPDNLAGSLTRYKGVRAKFLTDTICQNFQSYNDATSAGINPRIYTFYNEYNQYYHL